MSSNETQYLSKTVKALRGTEARSRAKWEKAGWEFVSQDTSTLHTTLHFRRPKPQVPWRLVGAAAAVVAVIAVVGAVAGALQGDDESDLVTSGPSPSPSAQPSATREQEKPTPTAEASVTAAAAPSPAVAAVLTAANRVTSLDVV